MGKNNGQKGAKKAKLNNGSSKAPAFEMPSFDEKALDALTQRIDKGLSKGANSTPVAAKKEKTDNKKAGTPSKQKPNPAKKRDAEGNVKSPAQKGKNAPKSKGDDHDVLLQEILAFGGTEDDLDLVDGADSDAEEFDGGDVDKDLKNELARFITGLGIETQAPAEEEDEKVDDVEEEVDEDEEWQDDVVSEDEEEEEEATAPAATKPAASKPVVAKPLEAKPAQQRSGKDHLVS
jgi:ribosome biogenesis protein MAK21